MANLNSIFVNSNSLEQKGVDFMTLRTTAPEFKKLIYVFKGLRVLTQLVSVASGFCFFYYKLHSYISGFVGADVISAILAVCLLITIEGVVQYSIEKAAKMGFCNQYKWMAGLSSIAVVFFAISFYISTQGIYLMASDTTGKNIDIETSYREQKKSTKAQYEERINDIKDDIAKVSASTWKGKLSAEQQKDLQNKRASIESLYKEQKQELKSIDDAMQAELASIKKDAVSSASDYYTYVAVILFFELLTNFLVVFFYHHIMHDEQPWLSAKQEYKFAMDQTKANVREACLSMLGQESRNFAVGIAELLAQNGVRPKLQVVTPDSPTPTLNDSPSSAPEQQPTSAPAPSVQPEIEQQPEVIQPAASAEPKKRRPGFLQDGGPDGPINDNGIPLSAPLEIPIAEPSIASADTDVNTVNRTENNVKIYRSVQPQQNASTDSVHLPDGYEIVTVRKCQHCGKKMPASMRKTAKYCSDGCRKAAYNQRNPDKPLRVSDEKLS